MFVELISINQILCACYRVDITDLFQFEFDKAVK